MNLTKYIAEINNKHHFNFKKIFINNLEILEELYYNQISDLEIKRYINQVILKDENQNKLRALAEYFKYNLDLNVTKNSQLVKKDTLDLFKELEKSYIESQKQEFINKKYKNYFEKDIIDDETWTYIRDFLNIIEPNILDENNKNYLKTIIKYNHNRNNIYENYSFNLKKKIVLYALNEINKSRLIKIKTTAKIIDTDGYFKKLNREELKKYRLNVLDYLDNFTYSLEMINTSFPLGIRNFEQFLKEHATSFMLEKSDIDSLMQTFLQSIEISCYKKHQQLFDEFGTVEWPDLIVLESFKKIASTERTMWNEDIIVGDSLNISLDKRYNYVIANISDNEKQYLEEKLSNYYPLLYDPLLAIFVEELFNYTHVNSKTLKK